MAKHAQKRGKTMWYVVQVQSGKETLTKELCNELIDKTLFVTCFVPKYNRMKRYLGAWHTNEEVLFPGYLFLQTEYIEQLFHALKYVPKLTKILGTGEEFVPLESSEEEVLKRLLNEEYVIEMSSGYIVGENVHIIDGPMNGLEGTIKKINRHKRIATLELEMFGRLTEVSLGLEIVSKVNEEREATYS